MQKPIDMYPDVFDVMAQRVTKTDAKVPSFRDIIEIGQEDVIAKASASAALSGHQVLASEAVLDGLAEVPLEAISDIVLEETLRLDDMFDTEIALEEGGLRTASGGSATFAVNLDTLGVNINESTATLENNTAEGAVSGQIVDNVVSGNSGFTTVVFNSGNQVVLQNSLQVNIFSGPTE